jgi:hypothetical protein
MAKELEEASSPGLRQAIWRRKGLTVDGTDEADLSAVLIRLGGEPFPEKDAGCVEWLGRTLRGNLKRAKTHFLRCSPSHGEV